MKIKILNSLLIIDILTILLIVFITYVPDSPARIVLGIFFIIFFPGYVLVEALFPQQKGALISSKPAGLDRGGSHKGMDWIERIALSFGLSIALVALIGLGLNYTVWGITLESVLYSISALIIILSIIAMIRRARISPRSGLMTELYLRLPGWDGSGFNKTLTIVLAIAILGTIGTLGYVLAKPKVGEKFTEFYLLGQNGKAEDYPVTFDMQNGQVIGVLYGNSTDYVAGSYGQVTIGIVNHEQKETTYALEVLIDGERVNIEYNGQSLREIKGIDLKPEEKWEQEIGFAPVHVDRPPVSSELPSPGASPSPTGSSGSQKVEFLLYKNSGTTAYLNLHLWVSAIGQ